jgi:hypothetical protein
MKKQNFKKKKAVLSTLHLHPKLIELGFDYRPDEFFSSMLKEFELYERPIIDMDGAILTHSAEVFAAMQNGLEELEVYEVDLTPMMLLLLILLKHKYGIKNLIASYKIASFFRDLLNEDKLDEEFLKGIDGDINKKIAVLMHTSDSTIKRLLRVGDNAFEKLGLIQEGETSFKQVLEELKFKELTQKPDTQQKANVDSEVGSSDQNAGIEYYQEELEVTIPRVDDTNEEKEYYEKGIQMELANNASFSSTNTGGTKFNSGEISIDGIGTLKMDMSSSFPFVSINGRAINNVEYLFYPNQNTEGKPSDSFVLKQKGKDGLSIQITISNYPKAA